MPSDSNAVILCPRCGRRPVAGSGTLCDTCRAETEAGTVLGIPAAQDATVLAPPDTADDATRLVRAGSDPSTAASEVTMLQRRAAPADADATQLMGPGAAGDPDRTEKMRRPSAGGDATVLARPGRSAGYDDGSSPTLPPVSSGPTARSPRAASDDSGPLTVGDTFGRYTIVKLLGMGGMGAVYQAWDKELEVVVALKVIKPEAIRDPAAAEEIERRFKRELLLARQVTHRNVVRIHDLGEIGGIKYITMSYVDGRDLASLLKEMGRLPIPMTLRIMRSVLSGLVAAHTAGVVHRDLKPANIMIGNDGEALIMDFGIARSTSAPPEIAVEPRALPETVHPTGRYTEATVLGTIVGTVEYMAPEQARGEAVDQRADVYTYGLILYDMLVGARRAERPGSALEKLKARMESALPPLKAVATDVPDALAAIVTKATQPDAADRYRTSAELAEALDSLDEHGVPRPIKRVVRLPVAIAAAVLLIGGAVASYLYFLKPPPPPPGNTSVVIADFENRTAEPTFDRTLEPNLRRVLEGAGFITAYDRVGLRRTVGVALPEKLDEGSARELAAKQGLNMVLSGAVEKQGSRYQVSMKVTQAVDGSVVADVHARANTAEEVIPAATRLAGDVREALGDRTTATDPIFAQRSLSASSTEVLRYYAAAQNAAADSKWDEVQEQLLKAIALDPNFGLGYVLLSSASRNLGNVQAANDYVEQAMSHMDSMTTRERLVTRGLYFRLTGDYEKCLAEQRDLIKAYPADVVGHNQLAVCAGQLRDFKTARDEMAAIVRLLPKRTLFRNNLALQSIYLSDFAEGEKQARLVLEQVPTGEAYALLELGASVLGQERPKEAIDAYTRAATTPSNGPTFSASGLADVAVYEGRYGDAIRIAEQGAAADIAAKNPDRAAAKLLHQAYAHLLRNEKAAAVASAQRSLGLSKALKVRFLTARIAVEAGQPKIAAPLIAELLAAPQPESQAYGKLLASMTARVSKDYPAAIKAAEESTRLFDTWIGRFELGRAYLAAGEYLAADAEFDRCVTRRGEAAMLFLDEESTYGYFPIVNYYQGLVREGMKRDATDKFRAYLAIREAAGEDPLVADIRRRLSK
ncbi:MAG TPA: protein kinase [Vicinamibacterales bacterium]|nr:protein kinase [Vicinamibacterales bacterium]